MHWFPQSPGPLITSNFMGKRDGQHIMNKALADGYDTVFLLSMMYVVCTMYVSYS